MKIGYEKQSKLPFDETVAKLRNELSKEGLGVITEIDVKKTFKEKLALDFGNYVILGVCHPATAHKVLEVDKKMGLMLPCNVIVYEENERVLVSAILPTVAIGMVKNEKLMPVAEEVEKKLKKVIDLL